MSARALNIVENAAEPELAEILREVHRIEVHSRRLVRDVLAGGFASVFRGSGIEFHEVREYSDGDDPRSIDWNVTARLGRPFVKTHVDERQLSVLFLLDVSASMDGGFGPWSARSTAARVCATLALSAVHTGDKVGLVAFAEGVERFVPARKGTRQALRILRDSLLLRSTATNTDPVPALEFAARATHGRAVLFVISDFLQVGPSDPFAAALARCNRRHDVVAVRLVPPELDAPPRGLVRALEPESGRVVLRDFSNARVRATWAEGVAAWRQRHDALLRRARVDVIDVLLPRPSELGRDVVTRPILEFFRMRELRGDRR